MKTCRFLLAGMALCALLGGCEKKSAEGDQALLPVRESVEEEGGAKSAGTVRRYQEETVTIPDGIGRLYALQELDGEIKMLTDKGGFSSKDGGEVWETWEMEAGKGRLVAADISGEGTAVFLYDTGEVVIERADGNKTQWKAKLPKNAYKVRICSEDKLVLSDIGSNFQIVDMGTGKVLGELAEDNEYRYVIEPYKDQVLTLTQEGVKAYSQEGQPAESSEVVNQLLSRTLKDFESFVKAPVFAKDENGFYMACSEGLFHYNDGGSVTEQILDGNTCSMGDDDYMFEKMAVLDDGSIMVGYITVAEGGSTAVELKRYAYKEAEAGIKAGELTLYTLYKNGTLEAEINAYNKEHMDCPVNIEVGVAEDSGMTADDAIKLLNTEILAGDGPDVLILDGMDVEGYCESGIFTDLSEIIEAVDKTDGIYQNIASAYEKDGKICALPARFQMPVLMGKAEELERITDLSSLAATVRELREEHTEVISVLGIQGEELLTMLFDICAPAWFQEDGAVKEEGLREYLEAAKAIQDFQVKGDAKSAMAMLEEQTGGKGYNDGDAELYQPGMVLSGRQALAAFPVKSMNFMAVVFKTIQEKQRTDITFKAAVGQCGLTFLPKEIVGINAKGTNVKAAKAFVEQFLSTACQEEFSITDTAFPVNKAAFQNMMEKEYRNTIDEGETYDSRKAALQEGFEKIQEMAGKMEQCAVTNEAVKEAVIELGKGYLDGSKGLEETVEGIVQRVRIQMAE